MKYFTVLLLTLILAGCNEDHPELIPLNTVDRAKELCQTMDGVKALRVDTYCVRNGKFCSDALITKVDVTCNKHEAKVSILIEWEEPDVTVNR